MAGSLRDAWWDLVQGARCLACGRPGRLLCPPCSALLPVVATPVRPTPCPPGLAPCFAAGEYAEPLSALVVAHKERRALSLTASLGRVLAGAVADAAPAPGPIVLVPVPSRRAVVRARGHDPMLRTTRAAAARLRGRGQAAVALRLLVQRRRVTDQAGLDREARAANLRGSMAVAPAARRALVRGGPARVVVCDDVLTTGATAREAQRALEDAGVPVTAVACIAATRRRAPQAAR